MIGVGTLLTLAKRLYYRLPVRLHWVSSPAVFCYRFLKRLRPELWLVTGEERSSHLPLSVLCAASNQSKAYLRKLIFKPPFHEQNLGRTWVWNILKRLQKAAPGCSVILTEVEKSHCRLLGRKGWFFIPSWVRGEAPLPRDPSVMKSRSVQSDLRRIRKCALDFEVTRDRRRFDDFYHTMYLPYATRAHGDMALTLSYKDMRAKSPNFELLLVRTPERDIAGILIVYDGTCARLGSLGARDGLPDDLLGSAVGALFHFSLQYLEGRHYAKATLGYSRAFLRDGVLRYKKKWSQRIISTFHGGFALKLLSDKPAIRAFLQNNPFIIESGKSLYAAVFVDTEQPLTWKELTQIDKDYYYAGLSGVFVYPLPGRGTPVHNGVPPELSGRVALRSWGEIVDAPEPDLVKHGVPAGGRS